jgi:hypothetical protein
MKIANNTNKEYVKNWRTLFETFVKTYAPLDVTRRGIRVGTAWLKNTNVLNVIVL